jgi:hypothetical protein
MYPKPKEPINSVMECPRVKAVTILLPTKLIATPTNKRRLFCVLLVKFKPNLDEISTL